MNLYRRILSALVLGVVVLGAALFTAVPAAAEPWCNGPNPPPVCDPGSRPPTPWGALAVTGLGPGRDLVVRGPGATRNVALTAGDRFRVELRGGNVDLPTTLRLTVNFAKTCGSGELASTSQTLVQPAVATAPPDGSATVPVDLGPVAGPDCRTTYTVSGSVTSPGGPARHVASLVLGS